MASETGAIAKSSQSTSLYQMSLFWANRSMVSFGSLVKRTMDSLEFLGNMEHPIILWLVNNSEIPYRLRVAHGGQVCQNLRYLAP
jgi:hypothetical protein